MRDAINRFSQFSEYELQDHLAAEIARIYATQYKEPFFVAVGHYQDCDLVSRSGRVKVEVKCDFAALRTGNVCIEFWNTELNEPSGVLKTHATLWLHLVLEDHGLMAIELDINVLRRLAIEHGEVRSNGRNALCKIIPLSPFRKHARRCFPFDTKFLEDIELQRCDTVASTVLRNVPRTAPKDS